MGKLLPLIPSETVIQIQLPIIPPDENKKLYLGTIPNAGVYITNNFTAIIIKNNEVKDNIYGEVKVTKQTKILFRNGTFYSSSKKEIDLSQSELADSARNAIEDYVSLDIFTPFQSTNVEFLIEEMEQNNMVFCFSTYDVLKKYCPVEAEFSWAGTLSEGADNLVLKAENKDYIVLSVFCKAEEKIHYDSTLYTFARSFKRHFRVGYDSHGRLTFFTTDTAVIFPHIVNKELKSMCSTSSVDAKSSICTMAVTEDRKRVGDPCTSWWFNINSKMEDELNKSSFVSPVTVELAEGKSRWRKVKTGRTIKYGGVEFKLVAETDKLEGYVSDEKRVKLLKIRAK